MATTTRRTRYAADPSATAGPTTSTEKGISLARAPALILGTILLAAGLFFLYKARTFPKFSNFPNGDAPIDGKYFFGIFGANGWTGMLTAVAGGLLLFGAAQHLLAKTMSLIVGIALGAAAVIAAITGNVLGMAAANGWTELGWAVCAAILLFNTVVPRRRRTVVVDDPGRGRAGPAAGATGAAAVPVADRRDAGAVPVDERRDVGAVPVDERRDAGAVPVDERRDAGAVPVDERGAAGAGPVDERGAAGAGPDYEEREVAGSGRERDLREPVDAEAGAAPVRDQRDVAGDEGAADGVANGRGDAGLADDRTPYERYADTHPRAPRED